VSTMLGLLFGEGKCKVRLGLGEVRVRLDSSC
jgi:hypothetical protein